MKAKKPIVQFLAFLILTVLANGQPDRIGTSKLPDHPRILMLKGEEAGIKKNIAADKTWRKIHQAIITESDNIIGLEPIKRIQIGRRLLDKSREALRRLFMLSYAYRMTQQKKYLERAEKEMVTIAGFSDWNPSHFLDVGEMTMAMAIGYDWLYNGLSPNSKTLIKEAILKKGLEPSLDTKYNSWLKAEHNWNQVCNAGMTYGAMAIYEDQPDFSNQMINRAIETIVYAMKDYGPDGAYPEGYGYWGYGTSFNVMLVSALEKAFGSDFGLNAQPGFLKTARYMENMTGPTKLPFNYSDAGRGSELHPAMFWFANKTKDSSVLWVERDILMNTDPKTHVKDRLLPAIMLWSGRMSIEKVAPPKYKMWVAQGKVPVAFMRTSWSDTNAVYVAMKGGSVSVNHAHMDIGSFVMDARGVRWAMDFGSQEYESLESKGIQLFGRTQDAERWTVFRLTNLVHNTLTFNNQHQRVTGTAPIISSSNRPAFMNAITDLSQVYKGSVAKSVRGIALVDQQYVVVRDEIETLPEETMLRWTMLTPATVKITGPNSAELTKEGKKLFLQVQEPATITMKTWSTNPPKDYDAPNPGTTLVGFEVKLPANAKTAVSVALIPEGSEKKAAQKVQPLDSWHK